MNSLNKIATLYRSWRRSGLRKRDLVLIVAGAVLGMRPVGGGVHR